MCWDTGCRGNEIIGFIGHLTLEQYGPGIVYQLDQSSGSLSNRGVCTAFVHNTIMAGQDLLVSSGKRDDTWGPVYQHLKSMSKPKQHEKLKKEETHAQWTEKLMNQKMLLLQRMLANLERRSTCRT